MGANIFLSSLFKWLGGKAVQKGIQGVSGYFSKKIDREQNLDELDHSYDIQTLKAGRGSLKDEYLILVFTFPLIFFCVASTMYALGIDGYERWLEAGKLLILQFNSVDGYYAASLWSILGFVFGRAGYKMYRGAVAKNTLSKKSDFQRFQEEDTDVEKPSRK